MQTFSFREYGQGGSRIPESARITLLSIKPKGEGMNIPDLKAQ